VIHLDTNLLIGALVRGSAADRQLRAWLVAGEQVSANTIVWTEFLCGPLDEAGIAVAARLIPDPEPYTPDDAEIAGRLFNQSGRRRGTLADCMIAATAIRAKAALATRNPADFRRFESSGLDLIAVA
jgi:predicted nucleic acid-binding protein